MHRVNKPMLKKGREERTHGAGARKNTCWMTNALSSLTSSGTATVAQSPGQRRLHNLPRGQRTLAQCGERRLHTLPCTYAPERTHILPRTYAPEHRRLHLRTRMRRSRRRCSFPLRWFCWRLLFHSMALALSLVHKSTRCCTLSPYEPFRRQPHTVCRTQTCAAHSLPVGPSSVSFVQPRQCVCVRGGGSLVPH